MRESATSATSEAGCSPLGRLTVDPDAFARDIWGRRADLAERRGPFGDLFSLASADDLVARALRPPSVRMVRNGSVIDAAEYCVPTRLGGQIVPQVVEPRKVADLVAGGATLVLQSVHRHWPAVTTFTDALTSQLGHPCQVNAYLTPPGGAGLTSHADEHDVFAVQLEGSKQWWVDGLGDVAMRGGDVLYVPAGCRHAAQAERTTSLHLTIGMLRVTYRQVVERLLREPSAELDAPLPIGYRNDVGAAVAERFRVGLEQAVTALVERLESIDVARVIDMERRRATPPYERRGHLRSVVHADGLDTDSTIRWAAGAPRFVPLPESADGRAWVRLPLTDRALRLPAAAREPIERLARAASMRVGDLPGLDSISQLTLARRLVEERACVIAEGSCGTAVDRHIEATHRIT